MALHAIGYGPDDPCLLVASGNEVFAYDAATEAPKWILPLERELVTVLSIDPSALPAGRGASPWRTASASRAALAVDVAGGLHIIDPTLGQVIGAIEPVGLPRDVVAAPGSSAVAFVMEGRVVVWRSGERREIAVPDATAAAFAANGETLAVGTESGLLLMFALSGSAETNAPTETLRVKASGPLHEIVQHPDGSWLAAGRDGVFTIGPRGVTKVSRIPAGVHRMQLDAAGERLAVQRAERSVTVYSWPALGVLTRVEYTDRPVRGLRFGPGAWLGTALDHGDGNKIDLDTSSVSRTDTHPGRQHRSWTLLVEGKRERQAAKDAEEIRKMKNPFHVAPERPGPGGSGSGPGARVGIGIALGILVVLLKVCARSSRPSYNYPSYTVPPASTSTTCDKECALDRLRRWKMQCTTANLTCTADATNALAEIERGDCEAAKKYVTRSAPSGGMRAPGESLADVDRILAEMGVADACRSGAVKKADVPRRTRIVVGKVIAGEIVTTREDAGGRARFGETIGSMWSAADGTLFVGTAARKSTGSSTCHVQVRRADGTWDDKLTTSATGCQRVAIVGRSATDVYASLATEVRHYDGKEWKEVAAELPGLSDSVALGSDLLVASQPELHPHIYRSSGKAFVKETTPEDLDSLRALVGGPGGVYAFGTNGQDASVVLRRAGTTWTTKLVDEESKIEVATLAGGWVTPQGELFVGLHGGVARSSGGGSKWTEDKTPSPVTAIWGRSATDVYGVGSGGLVHFDGKTWSATAYTDAAEEITGNATTIFLAGKPSDDDDDD